MSTNDDHPSAAAAAPGARRPRVLHLILSVGETNSQYNEHCLPQRHELDISICSYWRPTLSPPAEIRVFSGDGTVRGFFRALRTALEAGPYEVVHAHAPQTGTFLALAFLFDRRARRGRRSSVYTVHDSYYDYKPRNKALMIPAFLTCRRVVFCSHASLASYPLRWRRMLGSRARVVPNSADLARVERVIAGVAHPEGGGFRVLSVGRLEPVKDPLALLQAFSEGADAGSRLTFLGAGSLEPKLREAVAARRLAERVEVAGLVPRDDVFRRAATADLYVSTSHGEGLPVGVMEIMAAGCPVVLSDIPPHREVVEGLGGVPLVPVGDVNGFAREIARFRTMSAEERAAYGRRCREHARTRFALDRMSEGYRAVYRELGEGAP